MPAWPATVAAFLRDQAEHGRKAATLARYASSIARLHSLADQPDPTRAELVRLDWRRNAARSASASGRRAGFDFAARSAIRWAHVERGAADQARTCGRSAPDSARNR